MALFTKITVFAKYSLKLCGFWSIVCLLEIYRVVFTRAMYSSDFSHSVFWRHAEEADSWHGFYIGLHAAQTAVETPLRSHLSGRLAFAQGRLFVWCPNQLVPLWCTARLVPLCRSFVCFIPFFLFFYLQLRILCTLQECFCRWALGKRFFLLMLPSPSVSYLELPVGLLDVFSCSAISARFRCSISSGIGACRMTGRCLFRKLFFWWHWPFWSQALIILLFPSFSWRLLFYRKDNGY